MTPRQLLALSNPLADPNNTDALKRFAQTFVIGDEQFGTVLVVGVVEGEWSWHVSVSALSDHYKPIWWEDLRPSQRKSVRELAADLLNGVGEPNSDLDAADGPTYQIVRRLTIEEERSAKNPETLA